MLELIAANPLWFWLSLGGVLLAAEMLGAGGYLLWSGVAALLVGARQPHPAGRRCSTSATAS